MTTTALPTERQTDDDEFEEPENAVLRRELGLRPIGYPSGGDGAHPDQRPCHSWCWVAHEEDYEHEVDCRHPLEASHTLEPRPSVAASLYRGTSVPDGGKYMCVTSTIEPRLQQLGQAPRSST